MIAKWVWIMYFWKRANVILCCFSGGVNFQIKRRKCLFCFDYTVSYLDTFRRNWDRLREEQWWLEAKKLSPTKSDWRIGASLILGREDCSYAEKAVILKKSEICSLFLLFFWILLLSFTWHFLCSIGYLKGNTKNIHRLLASSFYTLGAIHQV